MKLLKFYADWCGPCHTTSTFLKSKDISIPIEEINIDDSLDVIREYNIKSIPVVILLDDEGKEKQRVTGFNKAKLEDLLNLVGT